MIVRLPARLTDPAAAWPVAVRNGLPGPVGFYAALLMLGGAALVVVRFASAAGLFSDRAGARWADRGELRSLRQPPTARHG